MTEHDLEALYRQAESALKMGDYERAAELLKLILREDHEFRDVSRLLSETVRLRRRRWYSHPLLWGAAGLIAVIALGLFIMPRVRGFNAVQPSATAVPVLPSVTPSLSATVTATATFLPTPTPIPLTWKRISIGGEFQRDTVTAFATDKSDPDVIYAAMKNSGVYKTIDGGFSWHPSHQGLTSAHVESLLIDPQNPRILFAGTTAGIFKTEDGGGNWFKTGEGTYLLMDAQNSSHIYARNENNIFETTDRGETWKIAYSSAESCPGKIQSWAIHPTDGGRLFITGESCAGVYQSGDSRTTWDLIGTADFSNITSLAVGVDEQGTTVIYAFSGGRWYESFDGGVTWSTMEILAYQVTILMVDSIDPSISYVASATSIFTRQGRGAWQRIPNSQSRIYSAIHIDYPNGIRRIITSATDISKQSNPVVGVLISKDEGASWPKQDNGIGSARAELMVDPRREARMYLASYYVEMEERVGCTLLRSPDNGKNWAIIYEAWDPPSWCGPTFDPITVLYLMITGRMQKSSDGGDTWMWYQRELASYDPKTGTSKDGTLAFALPNFYRNGYFFEGSQSVSTNPYVKGLVYDVGNVIYYSADSGVSWQLSQGSEGSWDARLFYTDQSKKIYAIGMYQQKYSTDYGKTWQNCGEDVATSRSDSRLALDLEDSRLYLATAGQGVLISTDKCGSWQASNEGLGNLFVNTIAIDSNKPETIYAGTDGGAYISYDAGATWGQVNTGLLGATVVYSIAVDKDSNVYAATPYGIFKLEGN